MSDLEEKVERMRGYIVALAREHCHWQDEATDLEVLNWIYEYATEDSPHWERTPEEDQLIEDLGLTRNWRKT